LRVAVDIGGTFTDVVVFDEANSSLALAKALSTPTELARGVLEGLTKAAVRFPDVSTLIHGSTVVVNAIIELKGAKTALATFTKSAASTARSRSIRAFASTARWCRAKIFLK
jgi:N-methylhydantoinase A